MANKVNFQWDDPFFFEDQLDEQERLVRDTARDYAQEQLMPRVLEANRHEIFDREIFYEMGKLGFFWDHSARKIWRRGAELRLLWPCKP
jgi:glutaryl-CoA dehydrogenase